jgi:hypothetical protein
MSCGGGHLLVLSFEVENSALRFTRKATKNPEDFLKI